MPFRPPESPWDFRPVLDLIDSDGTEHDNDPWPFYTEKGSPDNGTNQQGSNHVSNKPTISLGTFSSLWEKLGISFDEPKPKIFHVQPENEKPTSPRTAPVSHPIESQDAPNRATGQSETARALEKLSQTKVDDSYAGMNRKQRSKARLQAAKLRQTEDARKTTYDKEEQEKRDIKAKLAALADQEIYSPRKDAHPVTVLSDQKPARSRSNVGAKVRPASPTECDPLGIKEESGLHVASSQPTHPPPALSKVESSAIATPAPRNQGFVTPQISQFPLPRPGFNTKSFSNSQVPQIQPHAVPALADINASLNKQYPTAVAPPMYPKYYPHGHLPPLNGNARSFTPATTPLAAGLVPSAVQPLNTPTKAKVLVPMSREDRDFEFLKKLMCNFAEDKKWLVSPMRLSVDSMSSTGIHVFVDASNILIGLRNTLRDMRRDTYVEMSFDCLALLLERRRPVSKRVYAGSTRASATHASTEKFTELAGAVGYEQNIYEQVLKVREPTEKQLFFRDVEKYGYAKAIQMRDGSGSDSETGPPPTTPPPAPKWVEQGVDESLHLKMCQSIIDTQVPTTMVLATGDGAAAEYSDGFLAQVERALKNGWKVELVSWKQQTNSGYKNRKFKAKWGDRFKIIELDEYIDYMIDT
ncbi:hypothetical protein K491DRAFT_687094 [Lophiostoma macrostomum CBS 122681]|uniref:NYN domain-containing protein n=1 Tax=Lophiostoma macrostomum CBS 122681 TaxID=1314788 RepID=A0A6A6TS03_9PLEO|nr:hypothetical protein K491DRAFT_687094 [Lophiostoma macrostomum CBS 122681]